MLTASKEFRTVENIVGPLILVKGVEHVGYGEMRQGSFDPIDETALVEHPDV